MALHKYKSYYPNYHETLGDSKLDNVSSYSVYAADRHHTNDSDRVGTVKDMLVDDAGRFRYVVVDTGPWIFGKNVLLPIGLAHFDYNEDRIYVDGLTKDQVEHLPEYHKSEIIDQNYEDRVREQYRPIATRRNERQFLGQSNQTATATQNRDASSNAYDRDPSFYGMSEKDNHQQLKLYEEKLVTNRERVKAGEVAVGKKVKTDTAEASVPEEKERVIIEHHDAHGRPATNVNSNFQDQEVARMDVYEDQVNIEKQPFVREEVSVRKETERDTVKAKEKVRREELGVDTKGTPNVKR